MTMGSVGSALGEGNADSLFKFDLNVERGMLKMSNSDIHGDINGNENNNECLVTGSEGQKKKKKKKDKDKDRERKEKKKSKRDRDREEEPVSYGRVSGMRDERTAEHFVDANIEEEHQEIQVDAPPSNSDWGVSISPPAPQHNIEISNMRKSKSMGAYYLWCRICWDNFEKLPQ